MTQARPLLDGTTDQQSRSQDYFFKWMRDECDNSPEYACNNAEEGRNEVALPDDMLRYLCRYVECALYYLVCGRTAEEIDRIVNDLLLLETRLERAQTNKEKAKAFEVFGPSCDFLLERLRHIGSPEIEYDVLALFTKLGPLLSQVPLRVGNSVYALIYFREENFRIRLCFHPEATVKSIVSRICRDMKRRGQLKGSLTCESVEQRVIEVIGAGPPYPAIPFTPMAEPSREWSTKIASSESELIKLLFDKPTNQSVELVKHGNDTLKYTTKVQRIGGETRVVVHCGDDEDGTPDTSELVPLETALKMVREREKPRFKELDCCGEDDESASHAGHKPSDRKMCIDCYRVRQEVQEDMIAALSQASQTIDTENNVLMREIFNPL